MGKRVESAGFFTRKPRAGDTVEIKNQYRPSGPALVLDKSNEFDVSGGTKMWPNYRVEFEDGTVRWVPITTMVGW